MVKSSIRVLIEARFSSSLSWALLWLHFCVSDKFKAHKLEKAEQITSAQQCGAVQLLSEDKPAWQLALFYPFWCEMLLPGSASNAAFWSNTLRQFYRQQIKMCIFFLEHFLPPSAKTCCCAEFILQPVSVLDVSSYKADNVLLALLELQQ